jgi:hypothetical protein
MYDALFCLENFFKSNNSQQLAKEYFNENCHECVLGLMDSKNLETRKQAMSIFGILVSLDSNIFEVN